MILKIQAAAAKRNCLIMKISYWIHEILFHIINHMFGQDTQLSEEIELRRQ